MITWPLHWVLIKRFTASRMAANWFACNSPIWLAIRLAWAVNNLPGRTKLVSRNGPRAKSPASNLTERGRLLFQNGDQRAPGGSHMHRLRQPDLATGLDNRFDGSHFEGISHTNGHLQTRTWPII